MVIVYQSGYHGRNSKVYDRRLTLHRGVTNPLTFTFKNEDQKKQDVSSKTVASGNYYQLDVIDTESKKAIITKTLKPIDDGSTIATKGQAMCEISDGDLLGLDAKFYNYSIKEITRVGFLAIATSGEYRNKKINNNGEIISHTFNPFTQLSIKDKSYSVTVVSEKSSMVADAWATALNALGPKKGIDLANEQDIAVMYIMKEQNNIIKSKSWNYSD